MKNRNHPKRGSRIKVEPIRQMKDIKAIKKMLSGSSRDLCLFILGINTNLRTSDLIRITAGQVRHLKPGDDIELKEKKTGKVRRVTLNRACIDSVKGLLAARPLQDQEPLLYSQRGTLTVPTINNMVKSWCRNINLSGNYGSHTLRKTFGYHQRVTHGTGLPELMVTFNHSTQRQTLDYLCIQDEEIKSIYMNEI